MKTMRDNIKWENDWANYMAMDFNGAWWEFEDMPLVKVSFWGQKNYLRAKEKKTIPKHKPYWKESLIKREMENKVNIKKIELYETSDDSVFRDFKEAEEHERLFVFSMFIDKIFKMYNIDAVIESKELSKELLKNKEKLKEILFD